MNDPEKTGAYQPDGPETSGVGAAAAQPQHIGRYRIEKVLGQGGFGLVYLAHDGQLQRLVAIKVPHSRLVARATDIEAYLTEARTVANLDHPHIVPVFDVGTTEGYPCYVVSKYIDGTDLASRLKQSRLSIHETVELVATVAEALHHAHKQGLVHRDIKPGNILLDKSGRPYVADFGLALREQDVGKGPQFAGTPAYMSPEQARGEGHRVDGRSDIFSVGVVLYELLVGRRPFKADSQDDLLEQVTSVEARPPRQIDDRIPRELERICLRALSKRASERYTTARDLADDLRHFLTVASASEKSSVMRGDRNEAGVATPQPSPMATPSDQHAIKIVPKGLRSFDASDADFFLGLLPGPRDRDGLPDSIRFWKTRIETTDADDTFPVGLIYGPSGCGKSSLVKAGLLPRLAKSVTVVYIEATAEETEARLLKGLRRQVPDLPGNLGLIESLAALRRGPFLESGRKVLLVLDQFEQWLHAKRNEVNTELVQALRQCDGGRLQCIVMVRDDFWLAVSRFMQALEVRVVESENSRLVDLFDLRHARRVLTSFGSAFGSLPEAGLNKEQGAFLDQAVAELAQDGKVISVRLALFAEMVKGKPWTPATLKEVGGIEGVGVTFLEETFTASTAPPQHQLHQKAAQAVLKALLPEAGTDIKGHMRSQQELLEASGCAGRPQDFDDLLRILDGEIRLITPTDPEGKEGADESSFPAQPGQKYYQLTHDYLVHSLRDWLTRKQKETRRGRAELALADRAAVWNARPENRQLPSILQWFNILWWTQKKNWMPPQRKMMRKAGKYHAVRAMVIGVLLAAATITGLLIQDRVVEQRNATHAADLVHALLDAATAHVPGIVGEMADYRPFVDPLLRGENDKAAADSRQKLHASLALLPVDATQVKYLYDRLLDATPQEVPVIVKALEPHKAELLDKLWAVAESPEKVTEPRRLRAAAALAMYDPENVKWAKCGPPVVNDFVLQNPIFFGQWSEALRPVKNSLIPPLRTVFRDQRPEHTGERNLATNLLADYAADNPQALANLLMDADEKQFAAVYPKFKEQSERGLPLLTGEIDKTLPLDLPSSDKEREILAKRQANAAVALLRMNQPEKVWPLLKRSPPDDPRVRSYLIHRLYPLGADARAIINRLDNEPDITIRRALLLSLGEFSEKALSPDERKALLEKLQEIYRTNADPGLHAAADWLLRTWNQAAWLKQVNDEWAKDGEGREKKIAGIKEKTPFQWYVNSQGQTFVAIPGPVEFMMGSPPTEAGHVDSEAQHKRRISRNFAVAAKSVTLAEYQRFDPEYGGDIQKWAPTSDCPVLATTWFQAAEYCNWLSKQEGLPDTEWCYEPLVDPKAMPALAASSVGLCGSAFGPLLAGPGVFPERTDPEFKAGMRLAPKYLRRTGYRLPTEAEMEFVTRAEALTSRFYGETEDLLPKYAWYLANGKNRSWPVGSLKPNDFGLFDAPGNVYTWCQEAFAAYPTAKDKTVIDDNERKLLVDLSSRVLRGGSFNFQASVVRSSGRDLSVPTNRYGANGFRLARTLPLVPFTALPATPEGGRQ